LWRLLRVFASPKTCPGAQAAIPTRFFAFAAPREWPAEKKTSRQSGPYANATLAATSQKLPFVSLCAHRKAVNARPQAPYRGIAFAIVDRHQE
jgi:hypothetical protein